MSSSNNSNSNQPVVPSAREALNKFKMEAANEVGVNLKEGYNGDLSSREAGSVGGPLNDAGDVGHDEGDPLLHKDHPQVGKQGGKVVVGDLGPGLGGHGQQGGLAHVGEAHQPTSARSFSSSSTVRSLPGRPAWQTGGSAGWGGKVLVAPAPVAPRQRTKGSSPDIS